ncbi:hypothetical protein CFP56_032765 [Quercus suber]|uniref:Uncharacterized protein n=1 Tax=Quercus suber TaxID=58331 RepID=A0AAW0JG06_QUESU|nr:hypothetical protein CFP56_18589 [Quercus suber]
MEEHTSKNDTPMNLLDEFTIYQNQPDLVTQLQRAPAARNMSSKLNIGTPDFQNLPLPVVASSCAIEGQPFVDHISNDKPMYLLANNAQDQALDENVAVKLSAGFPETDFNWWSSQGLCF